MAPKNLDFIVPIVKPSFPNAKTLSSKYKNIVESNWYTNFGIYEKNFSKEIGNYISNKTFATTCSSATSGLIASILAVLGKGNNTKYIIMPSFTFSAGASAVTLCGYKPLFIDINRDSLQMDLSEADKATNEMRDSIVALLLCNTLGVGNEQIHKWEELSFSSGLPLIIDSAAGFGSVYEKQRKVGSAGTCEVFSFHATKPFAIGEGGAVTSKDSNIIKKIRSIQNFGFDENNMSSQLGFNGKLQEINAAIGLEQLKRIDMIIDYRKKLFDQYKKYLDLEKFSIQKNARNSSLCFMTLLVKQGKIERDRILKDLSRSRVEVKKYYSPSLHKHEYFKGCNKFSDLDNTEYVDDRVLSLPIHHGVKESDIKKIAKVANK